MAWALLERSTRRAHWCVARPRDQHAPPGVQEADEVSGCPSAASRASSDLRGSALIEQNLRTGLFLAFSYSRFSMFSSPFCDLAQVGTSDNVPHSRRARAEQAQPLKRNERWRVNARESLLQKVEGFTASQREPFWERCVEGYTAAQVTTHRHFTGVSTSNRREITAACVRVRYIPFMVGGRPQCLRLPEGFRSIGLSCVVLVVSW